MDKSTTERLMREGEGGGEPVGVATAPTHESHAHDGFVDDDSWICEAHPERTWPHDECAGPGMPRSAQLHALVYQRDQARAINAELLTALKNWQNYEISLEQRQLAAIAAIQKAEGR